MIPPLHVVTDDSVLARPDVVRIAVDIVDALGDDVCLHVRGPGTSGRRLWEVAHGIHDVVGGRRLFVNDRVDVALALDDVGVQLPRRGFGTRDARVLLGPERRIGVSVGAAADPGGREEDLADADFVMAGSAFSTPSHPDRTPAGPDVYPKWVGRAGLPVVAIGGISVRGVGVLVRAGVSGVAVIRAVWNAPRPTQEAIRLLDAWSASSADAGRESESR